MGIIIGFWIFFAILAAIGYERQKPNKGGAALTVFKRGQAPDHIQKAMEQGTSETDEEKGSSSNSITKNESSDGGVGDNIAKNESIFTWENVDYKIPTADGTKTLLSGVSGSVSPGKLTALMGASGAGIFITYL